METFDPEKKTPEPHEEPSVSQPLPQSNEAFSPESVKDTGSEQVPVDTCKLPPNQEDFALKAADDRQRSASSGSIPGEPPWVRTQSGYGNPPSYARPAAYSDRTNGFSYGSGYPPKKTHTGRNVFLLIAAFLLSFTLGGGFMFCAIYTGVLSEVTDLFRGTFYTRWYDTPPSQSIIPDDGDSAPEDDGIAGDDGNGTAEEIEEPFVPVEGAPFIKIVTVEAEGENYREELDIPTIAELAKPSVVGVIKYISENPQDGYTIGSGTIFTEDGYIITNEHVVSDPYSITVLLNDGTEYEARVVASDDDADIAILKIDAHGLTPVEFGDSTQLRVGEISVAIGCPASVDLQGTTTSGIISALDRVITVDASGKTMRLLQTDAAINPGNSGGPLLNKYGQVIGINTVKMSSTTYEGLCFAIPTSELESIVADLFTYGYVRGYPAIGITASSVMAADDEYGGAPSGVLVASVDPLSGAYGKIEIGDIITHCNGTEVIAVAQINTIKNRLEVGDSITLTVYRRGETFDVEIELVDQYDLTGN